MQAFEYASPKTLPEAFRLLGSEWGEVDLLAGGTDLLSLMKDYLHTPKRVVSLGAIPELRVMRWSSGGLRLGAMVAFEELLDNAQVRRDYAALAEAARGVSSPQIRNLGTVGGDLCQRPRCWYFRKGFGLLGGGRVAGGEDRYHAILGNSGPAKFVSASSLGPPLAALGAKLVLASASGKRTVDVEKFFLTPSDEKTREVDLRPAEILTEIQIPPPAGARNATYEVRQRESLDWPLATASVWLRLRGETVSEARVVLGHVAPVPWVSREAAKALDGKRLDEASARAAAEAALQPATPLSQNAYKVQLAKAAVQRALLAAAGRTS
jgi:xanthine dehydrogenase YagS FAD-binding subunit